MGAKKDRRRSFLAASAAKLIKVVEVLLMDQSHFLLIHALSHVDLWRNKVGTQTAQAAPGSNPGALHPIWSAPLPPAPREEVITEVIDEGQDTLSVRWVTTEKIKDGKPKLKSRLVARGFEENTAQLSKHSPTCSKEAVRLTISIAGANGWICNTIDVKSAYLQGKTIEREVYLRPPPEFNDGKLWKLNKTVYGLSDAALQWYRRVKEELLNLGMKVSSLDPALFVWEDSGKTLGILCLYVDDIFWAGKEKFKTSVIDKLCSVFKIGAVSSKLFSYIGLNITNLPDGSTDIDQFEYIESIQPIVLTKGRSNNMNSLINEKERGEYRALIGQLNWVATQTRPDIAFEVCHHSSKVKNATVRDICS